MASIGWQQPQRRAAAAQGAARVVDGGAERAGIARRHREQAQRAVHLKAHDARQFGAGIAVESEHKGHAVCGSRPGNHASVAQGREAPRRRIMSRLFISRSMR